MPCPAPKDLPHPGIEPEFPTSPALLVGFFITSATWEAPCIYYVHTVSLCLKNWKTAHQTANTVLYSSLVGGRFLKFDLEHQYLSTLSTLSDKKSEDRAVGGIELCAEGNREHCSRWVESQQLITGTQAGHQRIDVRIRRTQKRGENRCFTI